MNVNIKNLVESFDFDSIINGEDDNENQVHIDIINYNLGYKYFPTDKRELRNIINQKIKNREYDFNDIDVSRITDLSGAFYRIWAIQQDKFRAYIKIDVSKWNVSLCKNFSHMFAGVSYVNFDFSKWDVGNGENFEDMFASSHTYNPITGIENWDMSKAKTVAGMFSDTWCFNKLDFSNWDVHNIEDFSYMFSGCGQFNQDLSKWNVSNGKDFYGMFEGCKAFDQSLDTWKDTVMKPGVENGDMFLGCKSAPEWYNIEETDED